jgi:hypothetical protein
MARSPVLGVDDATRRRHGDVVEHTVGQQLIGTDEVRLLSPQQHLLNSEQEHEK